MASSVLDLESMKTVAASTTMRRTSQGSNAGIALAEVVVGMALIVVVLAMIFAMNAQLLSLLNQGKQSTYATQLIAERVEQLRTSTWSALTKPTVLQSVLTAELPTATESNLPGVTEIFHIEPYNAPAGRKIECIRTGSSVQATGVVFDNEPLVKLTITVKWTGGKRQRERSFVTVMSPFRG